VLWNRYSNNGNSSNHINIRTPMKDLPIIILQAAAAATATTIRH
jgi:hypothetical protein